MGQIADFKNGEAVVVKLAVISADVRKTATKKDYLSVLFTDGSDELEGKWWNYNTANGVPESGKIYDVYGIIGFYQEAKQINLNRITLSEDQDMTPFMKSLGVTKEQLKTAVDTAVAQIRNPELNAFVKFVYQIYEDELYIAPSAKAVHHVGMGGNIVHSIEVFNIGSDICKCYGSECISSDLVKAGALLHDIGKARVYKSDGPFIDYTIDGQLFDHIVIGIEMLNHAANQLTVSSAFLHTLDMLKHIIASHHGKLEYGSPVVPKFIEAHIINIADSASATIDTILTANEKVGQSALTEKVWAANNMKHLTQLYVNRQECGLTREE